MVGSIGKSDKSGAAGGLSKNPWGICIVNGNDGQMLRLRKPSVTSDKSRLSSLVYWSRHLKRERILNAFFNFPENGEYLGFIFSPHTRRPVCEMGFSSVQTIIQNCDSLYVSNTAQG